MEYDPAHKTSSVTSTSSNTSSIWDPLPSLYTGRADSVSSAYEYDDLQEPESFEQGFNYPFQQQEQKSFTDFLDAFFHKEDGQVEIKKEQVTHHEVPSSPSLGRKRTLQEREEQEAQAQKTQELLLSEDQKNKELLSEDQKRANHIASEQKRRNTIRGGFKELTEIIPTLKNINNSKSTILFKSVDYIKQLDKRNKSLKERLAMLQLRVQQKMQHKKLHHNSHHSQNQHLPPDAIAALIAHKNQQKQLELLQEQLRVQQALLTKHNIHHHVPLYPPSEGTGYHSISIPTSIETPIASTTTSPTLTHASLVNNSISSFSNSAALVMPANNEWHPSSCTPSFTIPADESYENHGYRERLLSSGKLEHLRQK